MSSKDHKVHDEQASKQKNQKITKSEAKEPAIETEQPVSSTEEVLIDPRITELEQQLLEAQNVSVKLCCAPKLKWKIFVAVLSKMLKKRISLL